MLNIKVQSNLKKALFKKFERCGEDSSMRAHMEGSSSQRSRDRNVCKVKINKELKQL
jgi:hypothetical protein